MWSGWASVAPTWPRRPAEKGPDQESAVDGVSGPPRRGPCLMLPALLGHEFMSVEGWRTGSFPECINTASLSVFWLQLKRMLGFRDGWGRWAPHQGAGTWDEVRMRSGHRASNKVFLASEIFRVLLCSRYFRTCWRGEQWSVP